MCVVMKFSWTPPVFCASTALSASFFTDKDFYCEGESVSSSRFVTLLLCECLLKHFCV